MWDCLEFFFSFHSKSLSSTNWFLSSTTYENNRKHVISCLWKTKDKERTERQVWWRKEQKIRRRLREGERGKKKKAGLGNYWTRLGSWGNLSGTRRPRWWGCGRQDHMEGGLWLCSPKLVTRLLPSPWAECEMRLARPNVLHMHHLCHKTNLITVNYVAAIIRRGPATHTWLHAYANKHPQLLWFDRLQKWGRDGDCPPTRPGTLCIQMVISLRMHIFLCVWVCDKW